MSPRTGRPTNNPKNTRVEVRLTEEQAEMLAICAEGLNITKTEVIVRGIQAVHQELGRTDRKK